MSPCWQCVWCVGGLAGGGVFFLHIGSMSGAWVCEGVGGGVWFPRGNCVCGACVRELLCNSAIGAFLHGVSVCGGVRVCCVVWVLRGALFSVAVEVSEGRCVCDGLLGVLSSCNVGWGVNMGLTGAMFVALKFRGVVTEGVA